MEIDRTERFNTNYVLTDEGSKKFCYESKMRNVAEYRRYTTAKDCLGYNLQKQHANVRIHKKILALKFSQENQQQNILV